MNAPELGYLELVEFVAREATAEQFAGFRQSPEAQKT
jgi:hypothetical protein